MAGPATGSHPSATPRTLNNRIATLNAQGRGNRTAGDSHGIGDKCPTSPRIAHLGAAGMQPERGHSVVIAQGGDVALLQLATVNFNRTIDT